MTEGTWRNLFQLTLVLGAMALVTGCQTTRDDGSDKRLVPAARIPFQPYVKKVHVQTGEGPYPNLFTGTSYAVWGTEGSGLAMRADGTPQHTDETVPESKPDVVEGQDIREKGEATVADKNSDDVAATEDAMMANDADGPMIKLAMNDASAPAGPIVITCYLESQFPDMSIAYDAVGLRGIQFHLQLPDGSELLPVQKSLDGELEEAPVGALRRFGRKLTLYFPGQAILVDNPAVSPAGPGVRLVLTGFDSHFYFEWPATPDTTATTKTPRWDEDALRLTRAAYRDVSERVKRFSHEVD